MKVLSETLLKSAIAAVLKADKFEVTAAAPTDDATGIKFEARSKSGQVRVRGLFCDPQGELELEEPAENEHVDELAGEEPAANADEEDEEPQH
jgi:hypothetical protein